MECKVEGCCRKAIYKTAKLCQKHYFRMRRNGTVEIIRSRKYRVANQAGYQKVFEPDHPLAYSNGYVYEHRLMVYDRYGDTLPPCELCGVSLKWSSCHIDHIDRDVTNNNQSNLRPLCRSCNTFRDYPDQHSLSGRIGLTFEGITMTAEEWSRQPGVEISGHQIRARIAKGMSVEDAIFSQRKTHKCTATKKRQPLKKFAQHGKEIEPTVL